MSTSAMHNAIIEAGGKDRAPMLVSEESRMEIYSSVSDEIKKRINAEAEAVHIIMTGIDNDIYSIIDACPNAKEIWKSIERLMQGENINKHDVETNLFWAFGKFTSRDEESLESYYLRSSSNTKYNNVDNSPRIKRRTGNDRQTRPHDNRNQREVVVTRNKETIATDEYTRPVYDKEPLEKVHNNDEYNMFANKKQHPEQLESSNDTYVVEKEEHDLFASLIENMKLEIDESKKINKSLKKATTSLATELERKNMSIGARDTGFERGKLEKEETQGQLRRNLPAGVTPENGRMILESVENGPLIWPTVEENRVTKTKKYAELSAAEKIQADCDMKATNIILQGLPADIYSLVNHHRVAKDLWERVQLLMQCTSLTKQERECKLYDAFDKFTHIKGESLHKYYLRFTQLINDMNIYNMKMEQFQVNTKFLNSLPPE
ncbi:hypothetical protein Tco_0785959 [Tanacetum coccineum]